MFTPRNRKLADKSKETRSLLGQMQGSGKKYILI